MILVQPFPKEMIGGITMSEQEPKKYYEYYYTWRMAEAMRKQHWRNGRAVSIKVGLARTDGLKKYVIWYNRITDTQREGTVNARYYDK